LLIGFFKFFWLIPVSSVAGDEQLPATCFYTLRQTQIRKIKRGWHVSQPQYR
jgi:hypothetical protein